MRNEKTVAITPNSAEERTAEAAMAQALVPSPHKPPAKKPAADPESKAYIRAKQTAAFDDRVKLSSKEILMGYATVAVSAGMEPAHASRSRAGEGIRFALRLAAARHQVPS